MEQPVDAAKLLRKTTRVVDTLWLLDPQALRDSLPERFWSPSTKQAKINH